MKKQTPPRARAHNKRVRDSHSGELHDRWLRFWKSHRDAIEDRLIFYYATHPRGDKTRKERERVRDLGQAAQDERIDWARGWIADNPPPNGGEIIQTLKDGTPEQKAELQEWVRLRNLAGGEKWLAWRAIERAGVKARSRLNRERRRVIELTAPGAGYTTPEHIAGRWAMWGDRCYLCGDPATATDHVIPLSYGGTHWPANLRPICTWCNSSKAHHWPLPYTILTQNMTERKM